MTSPDDLTTGRFSAALTDVEQPLPADESDRPVAARETPRETTAAELQGPPWFPPQGGDIALIERNVPGNDPVPIIVCWHHDDQAWWNATGVAGPMPAQPTFMEFRELIVRKNRPLPWQERLSIREAIRSELIRQHMAGECNGA